METQPNPTSALDQRSLRHAHHARVFVPAFDDLGEIVDRYQRHSDHCWCYAIRLDCGGTVYGLTDADVKDRPDDTSEPIPPLLAAAIQRSEDAVCLVIYELALTDGPALIEFLRGHTDQQREQLAWRYTAWLERECEITREPSHILRGWQMLCVGAAASGAVDRTEQLRLELANCIGYAQAWDTVSAAWAEQLGDAHDANEHLRVQLPGVYEAADASAESYAGMTKAPA